MASVAPDGRLGFFQHVYLHLKLSLITVMFLFLPQTSLAATQESIDLAQQMYVAYYGRPGDPGGVNFWAERFDSSGDLDNVLSSFGDSQEYNDNFGSLSNEELVNGLFQQMFNRDSDSAGLDFYVGRLESGVATLASIAKQIADGSLNTDLLALDNKISVANSFTDRIEVEDLAYGTEDIDAAQTILAAVSDLEASVTSSLVAVNEWVSNVSFVVSAVTPADGSTVDALPSTISLTFDRTLLASSVSLASAELLASGGDGGFSQNNELTLSAVGISVSGATINIDYTGANNTDDVYQIRLLDSETTPITDSSGVVMDGDRSSSPGGDFISTFTVSSPVSSTVTLTSLQQNIFTPNCATSGCHTGASPQQGLNLSAGQTFSNTVGVASNEVPSMNRVLAGDPNNSYLLQKVLGTAAVGSRMPLGESALSNSDIQDIRTWIAEGAQDN
jgi:hypothetical protein